MKKSILNFGNALNKAEQKSINGGERPILVEVGPCGETGGIVTTDTLESCLENNWGTWYQNQCWICN